MNDFIDNFTQEDISENKNIVIFSYLGFLFIIPLFYRKNSPYVKFHANQGLLLFLTEMLAVFLKIFLPLIFGTFTFFMVFINFFFSVLIILLLTYIVFGILNTLNGKAKELPLIGKLRFIK